MPKLPPTPDYILKDARKYLIQDRGDMADWLAKDARDGLRLFLNTLENFIEQEEKREVATLEKYAKPDDGEFWSQHYPYQWQQIIGSQLRNSFIVSLISLCEFHIGVLCRDVVTLTNAKITHEDLKGGFFVRARKFLETFAVFTSPSQVDWERISDLYVLRNSIVHNAALVDSGRNSDRLQAFIERTPGISNPSAGVLEIQKEFCAYALERVENFMDLLHNQYVGLCTRLESNEG